MTQVTQRRSSILPAMARRIEIWPVDRLIPYVKNPRMHSEEQVAQIAASIVEFGFTAPILVASDAGILAGHGRLLAAQKLGLPEVPVVPLDHLSETQRKAYIIADNQLALNAGWNLELLRGELESLKENDFDLDLVGFTDKELDDLLADPEDEERANAAPPLPENAVSRPGDLWICGEHRNQRTRIGVFCRSPAATRFLA
jgi:ParB-like chromosome segregation protein Spo0J